MLELSAPAQAVIASGEVPLALFLEMGYDPPTRLNSTAADIDWNGETWTRTGSLGAISPVKDTGGEISGLKFTLSGVPTENIALALGQSARGKSCSLWAGVMNPADAAVLDTRRLFAGELNQLPISMQGNESVIGAVAIHLGALFRRSRALQHTDSMQQHLYPGDTSRRFMVSQASHQDIWPAASWYKQ